MNLTALVPCYWHCALLASSLRHPDVPRGDVIHPATILCGGGQPNQARPHLLRGTTPRPARHADYNVIIKIGVQAFGFFFVPNISCLLILYFASINFVSFSASRCETYLLLQGLYFKMYQIKPSFFFASLQLKMLHIDCYCLSAL